ncbi:Coiled-coil domain-containing protein 185 [Acipenser ruthenus]|uniref:Coiled-coil domain-containing protein 185 n=1 Tax=Acipenser ruthenus TaxID=7906 RepID=A0A444UER3_ACIRT|nr:coiled-coil domain-containing protein 177 [Acipenser ruthenus]RXM33664.1 Coiled-coil domain-containing protein 185 [Acipenser ruthenus]
MEDEGSVSPMLHLDLYNFESSEAEKSRYVLTSPRSLEACARIGLRPVELLHKPLSEFVDENPDTPLRTVTELYELHEKQRRRELRDCREERLKIIEEEKEGRTPIPTSVPVSTIQKNTTLVSETKEEDKVNNSSESLGRNRSSEWTRNNNDKSEASKKSPSSDYKAQKLAKVELKNTGVPGYVGTSLSLGDLSHYPATEKKLQKLLMAVRRETCVSVPERDRKIAALMLAKHEEKKSRQQLRLRTEQLWEEGKRKERLQKAREERERRQQLGRSMERWQRELAARKSQVQLKEALLAEERERAAALHRDKWHRLAAEQEARRLEKIEGARYEADCKKRYQEQLLREKEQDEEAVREKQCQEVQEKIFRASQSKLLKEMKEREKIQQENRHEKLKHLLLKREVEEQAKAEELLKRTALEKKLQKSQEKHKQVLEERSRQLTERCTREQEQVILARIRAENREQEQQRHKEAQAQLTHRKIQQAGESAGETVRRKAQEARRVNAEKKRSHQLLMQKVEEEEEWHRRGLQEGIHKKNRKSERILQEKKAVIEESRKVARASLQVRESVREQINSRSFDQMALEAQLRASLTKIKL